MARRRRFYARDTHGRFARTAGQGGVYRRKMSTRKKVAIAGAGAVAVGIVALGGHQAYKAGARKGWETGKKQGIYTGKPLRGSNGRMRPNSEKKDYSQNPFARGHRSVGPMGKARRNPSFGTRIRATNVAIHRVDQNYANGRRRTADFHASRRASRTRDNAVRSMSQMARSQARRTGANSARVRNYNAAQNASQRINRSTASMRRTGANLRTDARIATGLAGQRVSASRRAAVQRRGKKSIRKLSRR